MAPLNLSVSYRVHYRRWSPTSAHTKLPRTVNQAPLSSVYSSSYPDSTYSYNAIHPLYPGATVLIGSRNTIVSHFSAGQSLKYADSNGTLLPEAEWIDVQDDSIYDMVSTSPFVIWQQSKRARFTYGTVRRVLASCSQRPLPSTS